MMDGGRLHERERRERWGGDKWHDVSLEQDLEPPAAPGQPVRAVHGRPCMERSGVNKARARSARGKGGK